MQFIDNASRVQRTHNLYEALVGGHHQALDKLLHANFVGRTTEDLPFTLVVTRRGATALRRELWGQIVKSFVSHALLKKVRPVRLGLPLSTTKAKR